MGCGGSVATVAEVPSSASTGPPSTGKGVDTTPIKKEVKHTELPQLLPQHGANIFSIEHYTDMYRQSIDDPDNFWTEEASKFITWFNHYTDVQSGTPENTYWFNNGKLNVAYNCLDQHLETKGDRVALIWFGDKENKSVTYNDLFSQVCVFANLLKSLGILKGDRVAILLPNIIETVIAMLACARIGAIHVLLSPDDVDVSISDNNRTHHVIVLKHSDIKVKMDFNRDVWYHEGIENQRPYCPCEVLDSEDPLFYLWCDKNDNCVLHTQAGYLLYAAMTCKYVYDVRDNEVVANIEILNSIVGHSYIVYGALCNGYTSAFFENIPKAPRIFDVINSHKINILSSTKNFFTQDVISSTPSGQDLSSLRVLLVHDGKIDKNAWMWYFHTVGQARCPLLDSFCSEETGGFILTRFTCHHLLPGSVSFPSFGIDISLTDGKSLDLPSGDWLEICDLVFIIGKIVIKQPYPACSRSFIGDYKGFKKRISIFPGSFVTDQMASIDKNSIYTLQ